MPTDRLGTPVRGILGDYLGDTGGIKRDGAGVPDLRHPHLARPEQLRLRPPTYWRTVDSATSIPSSARIRSQIRCAVCCCLRGAARSAASSPSMNGSPVPAPAPPALVPGE